MRLTLVISSLAAGGAERVLSTLANAFSERGHEITLVTDAPTSADHYRLDPRIRRLSLDALSDSTSAYDKVARNIVRLKRLRSALVDTAPDAIVAFGNTVNVRAVLAKIGLRVPVLISERVDPRECPLPFPWRVLRRLTYPMADLVVIQTESVRAWAKEWIRGDAIRVLANPVVPTAATFPRPGALAPRSTIAAVGRLVPQKGFDLLLQSFAKSGLASSGWQLAILGEGKERTALVAQAEALGLQKHVLMPGIVKDPQEWLQHSDIFVLSSRFEGFPNALLEAMGCGLPVVAFDCPSGPREIVNNGQTGLLIPPLDVPRLSCALKQLAADDQLRRRLGAAAAVDVDRRFGLGSIVASWDQAIAGITAKSAP